MNKSFLFLLLLFSVPAFSQSNRRTVCLLDVTSKNGEDNISYLHAADHMLKVWGVPYRIETSLDSVANYGMVVISSRITSNTFTMDELDLLKKFVRKGGVCIAGGYTGGGDEAVKADSLNRFFGVSESHSHNDVFRLHFKKTADDKSFRWMDDPMEEVISLGNQSTTFTTRSYEMTTATALATYEDNTNAIIKNTYHAGTVYLGGIVFRDLISATQMDIDHNAERVYSNGFEPSVDAFMLFFKAIYTKHFPFTVWKHTVPDKRKGSLIVTHDMDSQSAMDLVTDFSTYEYSKNITATYNVTVRYLSDYLMGAFFLPETNIRKLDSARIHCGHVIGNHSIGHFPDMANGEVFETGKRGAYTMENYRPFYNGKYTTGGKLYAEVQLSKEILEAKFHTPIRTWRSGHLCYPKVLGNLLDTLQYDFNTSNSANNVLTNFPFRARTNKSNSGTYTRVLEIPMTISDVFYTADTIQHTNDIDTISDADMESQVKLWKEVTMKCVNNYAASVLLVHPNRAFKLEAMQHLLDQLPLQELDLGGMENFGDYWNYRETVEFSSVYLNGILTIIIPSNQLPIKRKLGLVIDNARDLNAKSIKVVDEKGQPIVHYIYPWYENSRYIMFEEFTERGNPTTDLQDEAFEPGFKITAIYPNPVVDLLKIDYFSDKQMPAEIKVYSDQGALLIDKDVSISNGSNTIAIPEFTALSSSLYFVTVTTQKQVYSYKVIKK